MKDSFGRKIRKAIVAGAGAGVSAVATTIVLVGAPTKDDVSKALGVFIVAFVGTAWATFQVRNAGSDIGLTGSVRR